MVAEFEARDIACVKDAAQLWDRFVERSPRAWCWSTRRWQTFIRASNAAHNPHDISFIVFRGYEPVCLAPGLVIDAKLGETTLRDGAYGGTPIPWPCPLPGEDAAEAFALSEVERRARLAGAGRLRLSCPVPASSATALDWFEPLVTRLGFIDSSYTSHLVDVDADVFGRVRERYRRYVRKAANTVTTEIAAGPAVTDAMEEAFFRLHVLDAGGQFRSRESYSRQIDLARSDEGFLAVARDAESEEIRGILLISVFNKSAFDSSVGIDPAHAKANISYVLKWAALKELVVRGIHHYELGGRWTVPRLDFVPSEKQRAISFFKDGWARGGIKKVPVAEKFLTSAALVAHLDECRRVLSQLFAVEAQ